MRVGWLIGLIVGLVLVSPRVADACGSWSMVDVEKGYVATYHVTTVNVYKRLKTGDAGKKVMTQWQDPEAAGGTRVVRGKAVALDIKDNKVLKGKKTIGTIGDDGTVTFGKSTYTIEFGAEVDHPLASWKLVVKRGDTVVLQTERASALCQSRSQEDVRRRVIFYLAWRHGHS